MVGSLLKEVIFVFLKRDWLTKTLGVLNFVEGGTAPRVLDKTVSNRGTVSVYSNDVRRLRVFPFSL